MSQKSYKIVHTKKSRKVMQTVLIVLLLTFFTFLFMQSSFFNCKEVVVVGNVWLDEEYILKNASVPIGNNLFNIDERQIQSRLELLPMVQAVRIEKRLPSTIYIHIQERELAAIVVAHENFILIDIEGFYIQNVETIRGFPTLPLITGLTLEENLLYGEQIDDKALKAALEIIEQAWDIGRIYFNEINILSGENDIILFTNEGIMVRIGNSENIHEKLVMFEAIYLSLMAEGNLSDFEYINISFDGLPVIR